METKNPLDESIESIKNFQKKMEEAASKTEDVKSGAATEEEEKKEPAYVLFSAIADSSINILQMPMVQTTFNLLADKIGDDLTKKLVEALTVVMVNSAYQAITFYDDLLKEELIKQFDNIGDTFSKLGGDVNAHTGVLEVFGAKLNNIEKLLKIDQIKKEIGES